MAEWKDAFSKGVACFRAQQYDEALQLLSQAVELNPNDSTILDSRAAVYERLGRTKEALLDSKQAIKLSPEKWQGYARSARLFSSIKKYDSALKMIELALERVKPEDIKRRTELAALRSDIETAQAAYARQQKQRASRTFYHFGRLPVEIAHTIFSLVVSEDHAQVVVLGQVCRDWRRVVVNTPSLWTFLTLSTVNPTVKAALWRTRSKGKLTALCIRSGDAKTMWALHMLELTPLEHLRTLSLTEVDFAALRGQLPLLSHEVIGRLEKLELYDPLPSLDCHWLFQPPTLALRTLSVRGVPVPWGELAERCERLAALSYHGCFHSVYFNDLTSFFQRNSGLSTVTFFAHEDVMLSRKYRPLVTSPVNDSSPDRVVLPALSQLALGGPFLGLNFFCKLECPNLRSLHISKWTGTMDSALDHIRHTSAAVHLEELIIDRCSLSDPAVLVRLLEDTKELKTLHLLSIAKAGEILEALADTRADGVLCPKLADLNVSHCPDVRDGPLIRLVKARLPPALLQSTHDAVSTDDKSQDTLPTQPSQLKSLVLDGCQAVTGEILPWLRKHVAQVRCQFATKKQASWKR